MIPSDKDLWLPVTHLKHNENAFVPIQLSHRSKHDNDLAKVPIWILIPRPATHMLGFFLQKSQTNKSAWQLVANGERFFYATKQELGTEIQPIPQVIEKNLYVYESPESIPRPISSSQHSPGGQGQQQEQDGTVARGNSGQNVRQNYRGRGGGGQFQQGQRRGPPPNQQNQQNQQPRQNGHNAQRNSRPPPAGPV